jgi:hypothetical protein
MKNVTVTLDEETAAWARVHAARQGVSLSRYIGELLHQTMRESSEYERAMQGFFARKPVRMGGKMPSREERHERGGGS